MEQYNCSKCFYLGKWGCRKDRETYSKGICPDFTEIDKMFPKTKFLVV